MEFLPTSWANSLAPHRELAQRFNEGKVSTFENVSIRMQHFQQAVGNVYYLLRPATVILNTQGSSTYHYDQWKQLCKQTAWIINPKAQANEDYSKDLQELSSRLWKYLAASVLGLTVISVACVAAPGLVGRVWN